VVTWNLVFSKYAFKDEKISAVRLKEKAQALLDTLELNPLLYEKLVRDLKGIYSLRINIQHRLVYEFFHKEKTVRVLRISTDYD